MTQNRDLVPVTVYLPVAVKEEAEQRAATDQIATAALLRRILMGLELPLSTG